MLKGSESGSASAGGVSEPSASDLAGQSTLQTTDQPIPANVKKRAAPPSFPVAHLKRARAMMAVPDYNAVSVLYVLRPGLNFSFDNQIGPSHSPVFTCRVSISEEVFEGKGANKKMAKQNAAEKALKAIICESESAENSISVPPTPNSTVSQDSKDGAATAAVVKAEPVKKEPEPTGSSPVMILNGVRPGIQFFEIINSQDEALKKSTGVKLYRMGVMIDGERFEGSATNKKLAKNYAAEAGLKKLFGLECTHTSDGIPVFTGDATCWARFKKTKHESQEAPLPQVFGLPEGKHPLQTINELYPTVVYTFGENATANSSEKYSAHIKIENTDFEGKGSNKKVARLNAAIEAVIFLKNSGLLEQRIAEKRCQKAVKPKWQKHQRPAFLKSNGRPFGPPKLPEEKPKDAVLKLKEKFGRVDYQVVSESTVESSEGEAVMNFTVSATVMEKTFTGDGTSKQQARLEAAEAALRGLGLWTEEDENVKEEAKRLEMEKARFARMLYGTNRAKGSAVGSRDWWSQGKSWVSGGVLEPNPLILPISKDSGGDGYLEDSQDSSRYGDADGSAPNMGKPSNEYHMGPPNSFDMGPQSGYGMGLANNYGVRPANNYGMGPPDGCGMGPQNNYGFQTPSGFRTGEQSGYGMEQPANYGGFYNDFGNGGNFSGNSCGPNSSWWGNNG